MYTVCTTTHMVFYFILEKILVDRLKLIKEKAVYFIEHLKVTNDLQLNCFIINVKQCIVLYRRRYTCTCTCTFYMYMYVHTEASPTSSNSNSRNYTCSYVGKIIYQSSPDFTNIMQLQKS